MEEPFPIGIGLRVPLPPAASYGIPNMPVPGMLPGTQAAAPAATVAATTYHAGPDGLYDFDQFDTPHVCRNSSLAWFIVP